MNRLRRVDFGARDRARLIVARRPHAFETGQRTCALELRAGEAQRDGVDRDRRWRGVGRRRLLLLRSRVRSAAKELDLVPDELAEKDATRNEQLLVRVAVLGERRHAGIGG